MAAVALDPDDVARLDERAQRVGESIGWRLRFMAAPFPEYICLVAGPDQVMVWGPAKVDELAAHEVDFELDALERGDRTIVADEDGDPRIV